MNWSDDLRNKALAENKDRFMAGWAQSIAQQHPDWSPEQVQKATDNVWTYMQNGDNWTKSPNGPDMGTVLSIAGVWADLSPEGRRGPPPDIHLERPPGISLPKAPAVRAPGLRR